jgi:hypothetical protein
VWIVNVLLWAILIVHISVVYVQGLQTYLRCSCIGGNLHDCHCNSLRSKREVEGKCLHVSVPLIHPNKEKKVKEGQL